MSKNPLGDSPEEFSAHCRQMDRDQGRGSTYLAATWARAGADAIQSLAYEDRLALLTQVIEAGLVPILGGLGGFSWNDLAAIGSARKVRSSSIHADGGEIAYKITLPAGAVPYINDHGQFRSNGQWVCEGD